MVWTSIGRQILINDIHSLNATYIISHTYSNIPLNIAFLIPYKYVLEKNLGKQTIISNHKTIRKETNQPPGNLRNISAILSNISNKYHKLYTWAQQIYQLYASKSNNNFQSPNKWQNLILSCRNDILNSNGDASSYYFQKLHFSFLISI